MSQVPHPSSDRCDSLDESPAVWNDGHLRFADRHDAGRRLAVVLDEFRYEDPVVVGIPPGGMAVAGEVARALAAPLDVVALCPLVAREDRRRPIGVLGECGVTVLDADMAGEFDLGSDGCDAEIERAKDDLDRLLAEYHPTGRRIAVAGRTVLLVDDGLVSARNAQAAARSLRERGATRVILAVPVAESSCATQMRDWVDQVLCLEYGRGPRPLGFWYDDFGETSEAEVVALLSEHLGARERVAEIEVSPGTVLNGHLTVPWGAYARGVILLADSSRRTSGAPCGGSLADALNRAGLATLQLDLLRPAEEIASANAFGVDALAGRLVGATRWLRAQPETARLAVGLLGSDSGCAAALAAAARLRAGICAVVTCDGRPDRAKPWLSRIVAPVLMISVEPDQPVTEERVAALAIDWLTQHLTEAAPIRGRHRVALA